MTNIEEIWKQVANTRYYVSNLGNIKSKLRDKKKRHGEYRFVKGWITEYGYLKTRIDGKDYNIHRLVAVAFIPNPENKPEVNHINGLKSDNRLCNLEWATKSENMLHANRIGLARTGDRHPKTKIADSVIESIRHDFNSGIKQSDIHRKYGIARSMVSAYILNKRRKNYNRP